MDSTADNPPCDSYCVADLRPASAAGEDRIGQLRSHHLTLHNALLAGWSLHRLEGGPVCVFRRAAGRLNIHWASASVRDDSAGQTVDRGQAP